MDYADPFDPSTMLRAGKLRTGYTDFADYSHFGIRLYKRMRIYLWSAI